MSLLFDGTDCCPKNIDDNRNFEENERRARYACKLWKVAGFSCIKINVIKPIWIDFYIIFFLETLYIFFHTHDSFNGIFLLRARDLIWQLSSDMNLVNTGSLNAIQKL